MSAFGGGVLEGSEVVRFVFTDEGGISRGEPFVVVAGIFVHGDGQVIPLEDALDRLVEKHIPVEFRHGFVFHAKDIWSGTGKVFGDRERWPLHKRLAILTDLAKLPHEHSITIVFDFIERAKLNLDREEIRAGRPPTNHEHSVAAHALAFCLCTLRIEQQMRARWPNEIAQIVAEDNGEVRALVKGAHALFRDSPEKLDAAPLNLLPLTRIRGSVHFAEKPDSKPLQLADLCAFVLRGHLAKHPHNPPLYDLIKGQIVISHVRDV